MREAEGPCRIDGVAVTKVVIESSVTGEKEIGASVSLVGKVEGVFLSFGQGPPIRSGWPDEVIKAADDLIEAMEDHLVGMVFEEDEDGDSTIPTRTRSLPPGLIGPELGTDEEGVEQL